MEIVSRTLRLAAEGDAPPPPYFSVTTVERTILSMAAQHATLADQQRAVLEVRRRCLGAPWNKRTWAPCMCGRLQGLHVWRVIKRHGVEARVW